jgi:leader peptidase (prepilin peptidase)/N-methyltransferase
MLSLQKLVILIGITALGWLVGSLLNYLADILPAEPRRWSAVCPQCQTARRWSDYFLFKRCGTCGAKRSLRTWITQIGSIAAVLVLWIYPPDRFGFWMILPCMLYFSLVAVIDIEHHLILHVVSMAGAVIVIPIGLIWNGLVSTLIGGVAGAVIMFLLYYLGELFRRWISRARHEEVVEEALGFGDVTLSAVLGLLLGWPKITFAIIMAILLAGLASGLYLLTMLVRKKYLPFTAIPYGPFLLIGAVVLIYLA